MITEFWLIRAGLDQANQKTKKAGTAVQNPRRLADMIDCGQAMGTQTVFLEPNMDKILENLTALQREIDWPGDQLWTVDQLQNCLQWFALTQTTICPTH